MSQPELVDTHAHLGDEAFDEDRAEVLRRARDAGVKAVIAVGETLDDARTNLALADLHPEILPTAGLYPTHLDSAAADRLIEWTRQHLERLIAIGEVGLDHWKVEGDEARAMQHEIFSRFIDLSKQTDLPLNVHSRSAGRAAIELLLDRGATRVQLHAFDGRAAKALAGVEAGFFFSIPPSVVRSPQKQKLVRRLPLQNLLVETDSPALGPVAGERNEPANVAISVTAIAELKELAEEAVVEAVVENQHRLYGL